MLEARAELSMRPSFDLPRTLDGSMSVDDTGEETSSSLAKRLREIFQFEKAEDVIEGKICDELLGHVHADLNRISLLATKERSPSRLYVHYD
jgi:hypothetical protein